MFKQIQQHPHAKLGLATGGTMTDVYHYLVNLLIKNKVDVSQVETFNLDEYVGLKASHQQSYHTYMNKVLFEQYPHFVKNHIHIPDGLSENLEAEAERYNNLLDERGPIDIQILGIGENGHIGFNEPGTDFNSETHVVNLTESTIKANSRFLTMKRMFLDKQFQWGKSILKAKGLSYSHLVQRKKRL